MTVTIYDLNWSTMSIALGVESSVSSEGEGNERVERSIRETRESERIQEAYCWPITQVRYVSRLD